MSTSFLIVLAILIGLIVYGAWRATP